MQLHLLLDNELLNEISPNEIECIKVSDSNILIYNELLYWAGYATILPNINGYSLQLLITPTGHKWINHYHYT